MEGRGNGARHAVGRGQPLDRALGEAGQKEAAHILRGMRAFGQACIIGREEPHLIGKPRGIARQVQSEAKIRETLKEEVAKRRAVLIARGTPVTFSEVEEWRIANGYLWKVVSPKGNVYTEVLKSVTISEPEEYIEYNALKAAAEFFAGYVG